ncbi:flavin reductase, partial [Nonomuraea sp. MCN248]
MSAFTDAMGQLAAGVSVVTVRDDRDDLGVTISALMSVSLDPPLVLVSLGSRGYLSEVLLRRDRWACSLLSSGQAAMASRFAAAGRP